MKYSKCDFCSYEDHGKCLFPAYFRNPHNYGAKDEPDPCKKAIHLMMQIMMCEIQNNNKKQFKIDKNIHYSKKRK